MYEDDRNSFLFEIHESRVLFSVHVSVVESVCVRVRVSCLASLVGTLSWYPLSQRLFVSFSI